MVRFPLSLVVTLGGLCLLLSGCGKQDAAEEPKAAVAKVAAKPAPVPTPEPEKPEPKEEPEKPEEDRRSPPPDVAKPPADAKRTKSGIAWRQIAAGKGEHKPVEDDRVWVEYTAWTVEGKRTGTTHKRGGQARQLSLVKAIPGWSEMIKDMVVGERRLVWIPAKLAHTKRRNFKKGMRVVDLELVKLKIAPKAPADVGKAPKDAEKSHSGLKSKVIRAGTGTAKPSKASQVTVKYAGWTTNGRCFDWTEGAETMSFMVHQVIDGWTEGLQLMVEGEQRRLWIPKKMAYDGAPGKPKGTLVFDIELIKISK